MKVLKLIGGLVAIFLASISISFIVLSQSAPEPKPKSPEDIVWEFLIKDKPMNPEVLKSPLAEDAIKSAIKDYTDKNRTHR